MTDSQETIRQMIKMIEQEAKEKAQNISDDAKQRLQIEKQRVYKEEREKLIKEFKKKEENDAVQSKTY
jgi:vacuolar-type H+-ATPase subunit E/Vma4